MKNKNSEKIIQKINFFDKNEYKKFKIFDVYF